MLNFDTLGQPTPELLHWLSAGQWGNRFARTVRLWFLVTRFYLPEFDWLASLPQTFTYPQLRDRLFAPTHSPDEQAVIDDLAIACANSDCICQQTLAELLFARGTVEQESWQQKAGVLTGLGQAQLSKELASAPFLTVHRSLRNDLQLLVKLGWLNKVGQGRYQGKLWHELPSPPETLTSTQPQAALEVNQQRDLLHILQAIAFVQPNLEVVVDQLWQQVTHTASMRSSQQRLFLHLDYILPDSIQEQVDDYQLTLEQLWATPDGGVIQFDRWMAQQEILVTETVYPVCLHYVRRAKYLTAYRLNPVGKLEWHNYRLDRIASPHLKVLPWGSAAVPAPFKQLRQTGQLPSPQMVETALQEAWGFNFYLPKVFLILRFSAQFARWYVAQSVRHPTFEQIAYDDLPAKINHIFTEPTEQQRIRSVLKRRSPEDFYYGVWVRWEDINVIMRLRDWRPNGEVIAPLIVREKMHQEVLVESQFYQD